MSGAEDLFERLSNRASSPEYAAPREVPWWSNAIPPIGPSRDFDRITALPRKAPPDPDLATRYTERLKRPEGTMALKPLQALALDEAAKCGGLIGPIAAGAGKTLVALLLPVVLEARRTVVFVPSGLRDQILHRHYPAYAAHWHLPPLVGPEATEGLTVIGYSELSGRKSGVVLDVIRPDLIVCDEAHSVAKTTAARTKRFFRYFKAHPSTRLCALSGTLLCKSIKEPARLAHLALGTNSPWPIEWRTLEEWSRVLDPAKPELEPPASAKGVLARWGEGDSRDLFRQRVTATPGVVSSGEREVGTTLSLYERAVKLPKDVAAALEAQRQTWTTPWGDVITDSLGYYRFARQLACGLNYRRTWPLGEPEELRTEWLTAKSEWAKEVRAFLLHRSREGMDSPELLAQAAASGRRSSAAWDRWAAVRHQAKPSTEVVWLSDFLIKDAVEWGQTPGLIWYEHAALGEAIAKAGGFEHFGPGKEADGRLAEYLAGRVPRTAVMSLERATGTDGLQLFMSRSLVTTPMANGKEWEQLLARTHRVGQTADEVECFVYRHTPELVAAVESARAEAVFAQQVTGLVQRLTYCNYGWI